MSEERVTVGWIGTGVMGAAMCQHLLAAGYPVRVFNRTKERARVVIDAGGQWSESPQEVAEGAAVVVTMVGYPADVREVILGDRGVLGVAKVGTTIIDMTTSEPQLAREIYEAALTKGVDSLDAPVSGGDVGARNATLVIMVGGRREVFDRTRPLLTRLGKATLEGGPGAGQHTKVVNQIAIASGMVGVCEALLYAFRAGLDVSRVIDTIGSGGAASFSLTNYGPRVLRSDFEPGFKIEHFVKDLGIALDEARRMNLSLPGLALAEQLYIAASGQGRGQKGTHALVLALAALSDVEWRSDTSGGESSVD
ncbi:MAG: NAD(P)-dependent oxidoreductase [Acidimicrobiales bacterium]